MQHRGLNLSHTYKHTQFSAGHSLVPYLPSCVSVGSWDVCRTCHTFCTDRACPTCERACASFGRCCLQTFCRSPRTHTGTASLLEDGGKKEGDLVRYVYLDTKLDQKYACLRERSGAALSSKPSKKEKKEEKKKRHARKLERSAASFLKQMRALAAR